MRAPSRLDQGRVVLDAQLGEGAQAIVFAAHREDQPVAVKMVRTDEASPRVFGEIAALQAVRHPHVVRVLGDGEDEGWRWIEMELLKGRTLDGWIRQEGAIAVTDALPMIFELCMGLAALHDRGIVHRDIKPSNVFVTDQPRAFGDDGAHSPGPAGGRVVVADLGVAQLPAGDVDYATITGTSLGTLNYAAPEQHGDAKRVTPVADQFGIGATIYAMVTAKRPSYLYAPEDMPHVYERLPKELHPLVKRCCKHDAEDRFEDTRALARAVAQLQGELTGEDVVETWMQAFEQTTPTPPAHIRMWWAFRRWLR